MFGKTKKPQSKPAAHDGKHDEGYLNPIPLVILFAGLLLTTFQIILYMTVINTAIPSITSYFGTVADLDWYSSAYLLSLCAFQPLTGQIYNLFRVKATYQIFIFVFEMGALICALSHSSKAFIVGRAISGVGAAGLFNGAMVMLSAAAEPVVRAKLMSITFSFVSIGGVVGPVLGGAITQHIGWRWCAWIFLPPGFLAMAIFFFISVPDQGSKQPALTVIRNIHHKLDFIGFLLFTPSVIMLLLAMSWGGSKYAWNSATVIALFCASVPCAGAFIAWISFRGDRSLIPPAIIMKPVVFWGCWVAFLQGGAFYMMSYYLPLWFQSIKGASPSESGIMLLPTVVSQVVSSAMCGMLLSSIPYVTPWSLFGNTLTAVGSGLMTTFLPSTPQGKWIGYQILAGVGRGVAMQMPVLAFQCQLSISEIAFGTAFNQFFQYFGGSIGVSISKTIFVNGLKSSLREYSPHVDATKIIHSGANSVLKSIPADEMQGVLLAYNKGLSMTFYFPLAASILAFFFSFGLGKSKAADKKKMIRGPGNSDVTDEEKEGTVETQVNEKRESQA